MKGRLEFGAEKKLITNLFSHPILKTFTKYCKENVFEVAPNIEVVNHLSIGFCQELGCGQVDFIDSCL